MKSMFNISLFICSFLFLSSCSDSSGNRSDRSTTNSNPPTEPEESFSYEPLQQLSVSSVHKNSHTIDMLPILPQSAAQYKPEMGQLKFQKICQGASTISSLKRVKFQVGSIGTDINTDFKIYYADNMEAYYVGDVQIDIDHKYMIVFAPGKSVPLFYVKYQDNYPQILGGQNTNGLITTDEQTISAPTFSAQVLTHENKLEKDYHLLTAGQPRCGRKSGPGPTANFIDTEITFYSASYQGELPRKEGTTQISCVNALQAIHSSLAHLQKKQSAPLKLMPVSNRLNAMQGNILRLACNRSSYIVPTSVTTDKIRYIGHSLYLAKLTMSVDKQTKNEDLYFNPKLHISDIALEYPTYDSIALSPYISEVSDSQDSSLKEIVAFIPFDHLIDCKKLYEQTGNVYQAHPEKRTLSTQIMQEFDSTTKSIQFEFSLGGTDEETVAEKCKGDGGKTSPLIIQFGSPSEVAVLKKPVFFDYDQDGKKDTIFGWPKYNAKNPVGVILYKDKNSVQLLGNTTKLQGKMSFADGHDALAVLDINKDGKIDSTDKILDVYLFIWFDKNNNAQIEKNEIVTFNQMNIAGIDVANVFPLAQKVSHPKLAYIDTANKVLLKKNALPAVIYDLWFTVK
jgi:hypothetical protein